MFLFLLDQEKTMQNYLKILSEGFPVYWNKYKAIPNKPCHADDYI